MDFDQWTTQANDAVTLTISSGAINHTFTPEMTEYVFSQNENMIIGYKDPKVEISFRGNDMQPSVRVGYKQKMKPDRPELEKLMDIEGQLKDYLPASAFDVSNGQAMQGVEGWSPPGEKLHEYSNDGNNYEIWNANLGDKTALSIIQNMKILVPMYIEGGTVGFLDDADIPQHVWTMERWKLFLLYQVKGSTYSLAGFSTSYRMPVLISDREPVSSPSSNSDIGDEGEDITQFTDDDSSTTSSSSLWPAKTLTSYPTRERISQFIILPPYQHSCHGIHLYNTITAKFLADPYVFEITVEDPNENFDNLRDYCDLARLYSDPEFANLSLPETIPAQKLRSSEPVPRDEILKPEITKRLCQRHKLIKRQIQRLLELHFLRTIPSSSRAEARIMRKGNTANVDDRKYYFFRLLLKQRIWIRNHEELQQIEESDRISKIESATDASIEQYLELLEGFDKRIAKGYLSVDNEMSTNGGAQSNSNRPGKKRKVIDDDDSDESDAPSKRHATEELLGH